MKCKYDIDGIADMVRGGYGFTNLNENGKNAAIDLLSIAAAALADGYTVAEGVVMKPCSPPHDMDIESCPDWHLVHCACHGTGRVKAGGGGT